MALILVHSFLSISSDRCLVQYIQKFILKEDVSMLGNIDAGDL